MSDEVWEKRRDELGWIRFGNESSALMALRGYLEFRQNEYSIGRNTLTDALHEHKEREVQHRKLRDAAQKLLEFADSVIGEPDKALISREYGNKVIKAAKEAIDAS